MKDSPSTSPGPETNSHSRTDLPAERAFVIQLRSDADLARGIVRGRIEHVVSGAAAHFDSAEQLVACMRDVVARRSATPSRGDDPATT